MRLVLVGNLRPSHSTENDWRASFTALGHEVVTIQEDEIGSLTDLSQRVKEADPAMLLYVRTWGLPGTADEAEALFHAMEAAGVVTAAVHLDRWRGLERAHEVESQAMFRVQHLFTADGDFAEEFPVLPGGGEHHWLRAGVLASEAHDSDPYPPWTELWDVAFVGSAPTPKGGNYHDAWPHRRELVAWLRETYGERFVHVGNGGDTIVDDSQNELTTLRGHWLNRLYRSVPVVVGDSCLMTRTSRYWSDRVYETWGRGGLLIHPGMYHMVEEIGDTPGHSWEVGDWDALRSEIDRYVADPIMRETKRLQVAEVVRSKCTYTHRAATLLEIVGLA